jgi:starvation-inducible DNA-binding protein
MNDELIKAMKIAFSSEFSYYLKAHFFHWNVEGPDFSQYHDLFGKIYEEVYGSIDDFAENIRKLGAYTPGSYTRFSMLSVIEEEAQVPQKDIMVAELLRDGEIMVDLLRKVFQIAEQSGEHGLSDFIAARMDAHQKHNWMLRSSLK